MSAAEFEAVLAEGKTKKYTLPLPIDVYVEYVSTGLDETGKLVFHPDVYETTVGSRKENYLATLVSVGVPRLCALATCPKSRSVNMSDCLPQGASPL